MRTIHVLGCSICASTSNDRTQILAIIANTEHSIAPDVPHFNFDHPLPDLFPDKETRHPGAPRLNTRNCCVTPQEYFAMEMGPPVVEITGCIARVKLCRAAHKNRLQPEDLAALREIFGNLANSPAVRVVVLQSQGDVFSAGFDLNALAAGEVGDAFDGPGGFGSMVDAIEFLPQPVIARVQGGVYGGATDMVLACDFRIGVTGMAAQMPAALIGLHYYKSGILRYASRLGLNNAKRMFLTAARLGGDELMKIGFLTDLVAMDALDEAVDTLAARLAANAPLAVQGVKLALNELAGDRWNDEIFVARAKTALASRDLREGIAAVQQKRQPDFKNV